MRLDVEVIRILSSLGIIWFHSGLLLGKEISYSGLICFVILSSYFAMSSIRIHYFSDRILRLILPCIIWSIFYAVFKTVRGVNIFPENIGILSSILATPAIHLWYLPFVFFTLILIDNAKTKFSRREIGIVSAISAILLILFSPFWREKSYGIPWDQYIHALPAVLIGVFFSTFSQIKAGFKFVLLIALIISILFCVLIGVQGVGLSYFVGSIVCLVLLKGGANKVNGGPVEILSAATFGVYLIHPFFIFLLRHFGVEGFLLPVLSAVLSFVFVIVARLSLPAFITKYVF